MADTNQTLHPKVNDAWRKHDEWLETGGKEAMRQVRESNLIVNISDQLYAAEGEGFKRGYQDGYKKGYLKGQEDLKRQQSEPQVPEPPVS